MMNTVITRVAREIYKEDNPSITNIYYRCENNVVSMALKKDNKTVDFDTILQYTKKLGLSPAQAIHIIEGYATVESLVQNKEKSDRVYLELKNATKSSTYTEYRELQQVIKEASCIRDEQIKVPAKVRDMPITIFKECKFYKKCPAPSVTKAIYNKYNTVYKFVNSIFIREFLDKEETEKELSNALGELARSILHKYENKYEIALRVMNGETYSGIAKDYDITRQAIQSSQSGYRRSIERFLIDFGKQYDGDIKKAVSEITQDINADERRLIQYVMSNSQIIKFGYYIYSDKSKLYRYVIDISKSTLSSLETGRFTKDIDDIISSRLQLYNVDRTLDEARKDICDVYELHDYNGILMKCSNIDRQKMAVAIIKLYYPDGVKIDSESYNSIKEKFEQHFTGIECIKLTPLRNGLYSNTNVETLRNYTFRVRETLTVEKTFSSNINKKLDEYFTECRGIYLRNIDIYKRFESDFNKIGIKNAETARKYILKNITNVQCYNRNMGRYTEDGNLIPIIDKIENDSWNMQEAVTVEAYKNYIYNPIIQNTAKNIVYLYDGWWISKRLLNDNKEVLDKVHKIAHESKTDSELFKTVMSNEKLNKALKSMGINNERKLKGLINHT